MRRSRDNSLIRPLLGHQTAFMVRRFELQSRMMNLKLVGFTQISEFGRKSVADEDYRAGGI